MKTPRTNYLIRVFNIIPTNPETNLSDIGTALNQLKTAVEDARQKGHIELADNIAEVLYAQRLEINQVADSIINQAMVARVALVDADFEADNE